MPRLVMPPLSLYGMRVALRTTAVPFRRAALALGHERMLGVAVAGIVLAASFLSVTPGRASGDTGGPTGDGPAPRLAVGGSDDGDDVGSVEENYVLPTNRLTEVQGANDAAGPTVADTGRQPQAVVKQQASVDNNFLDDGTLVKPVAVTTSVPDGSALMRTYRVKSGDTLATIAAHFKVSTMTLWWANDLKAKNKLVVGQELRIPPVSGLVIEVRASDTLTSLAAKYDVTEEDILSTNGLKDNHLVVGQVLMLPGARGAGISSPKPRSTPSVSPRRAAAAVPRAARRTRRGPTTAAGCSGRRAATTSASTSTTGTTRSISTAAPATRSTRRRRGP